MNLELTMPYAAFMSSSKVDICIPAGVEYVAVSIDRVANLHEISKTQKANMHPLELVFVLCLCFVCAKIR